MGKITNFKDLTNKLKDIQYGKTILNIFEKIEESDKNKIIGCINDCTSPVEIKEDDKDNITKTKLLTIFNAFSLFPLEETKVLILGQDPYPEQNKADGCAFSVKNNQKDASLLNIFKAVKVAYSGNGIPFKDIKKSDIEDWSYDLKNWANNNNVLLLNTALTHESPDDKIIQKHREAWEPFINEIIKKLMSSENRNKLVVFLWGKHAQCTFFNAIRNMGKLEPDKCYLMRKMILMTSHPSNTGGAVNLGFSEDAPKHFKACDEFLDEPIWENGITNKFQK